MRNVGIGARLLGLAALFTGCLLVYGAWSFKTLGDLQVTGPLYQRIVQSKDLIADVLPPPVYIIESYLVVLQLERSEDGTERTRLLDRLRKLKGEYDARHAYWSKQQLEPELKRLLVEESHKPALDFYAIALGGFTEAVQKNDRVGEIIAVAGMATAYEKHRAAVDQVVKMSAQRIEADETAATATLKTSRALMLAMLVIALALSVGGAVMIGRPIVRKLARAARAAEAVSMGDLTRRIEIGSMDEAGKVLAAMAAMQKNLGDLLTQVRESAESVASASSQLATGTTDLSQRTEEQASSLEETAASMEELASTVRQNAENATQADALARTASQRAEQGGSEVVRVVATMTEISQSAKKITDIVSVIDSIAFQTNILALNAAVEAARAGEQGRGFAVVASEVRSLAQRSAQAAKEIKDLIGASVQKVTDGTHFVEQAGSTIEALVVDVKRVSDLMASIAEASAEQARGVQQVNKTVTEMDKVVQQNASAVQESAAAAEGMRQQAEVLVQVVGAFQIEGKTAVAASATRPREVARPAPPAAQRPVPALVPKRPSAPANEEWQEF